MGGAMAVVCYFVVSTGVTFCDTEPMPLAWAKQAIELPQQHHADGELVHVFYRVTKVGQ